jgi:hypothetical protein
MRKLLSNGLAIFAGVVAWPVSGTHADSTKPVTAEHRKQPVKDPRLTCLRNFFGQSDCPAGKLSHVFLEVSDRYGLDWRLLPSLSFVESTGGKYALDNNLFGWNSGRAAFSSAAASIRSVAHSLAHSTLYRGKDVDGILKTYNQKASYALAVKEVMQRIAPTAY